MKKLNYPFCLLLLSLSITAVAQNKPAWIGKIEDAIKKNERVWKIDHKIERGDGLSFSESLTLRSAQYTALIEVHDFGILTNPEETFAVQVSSMDKTLGKNTKKVEFGNFGNQGYIWPNINKDGWTNIDFRKGTVFVNVYAPSPAIAKRFAQYVINQMP